jgi:class 3 adenylate cyclase
MWAVLFTDLVGSTAQRSRLGDAAADELRRAHDATVARAALDASGEVVKGTGDGAMVVFDGAADALAAAVSIQQGIELWNRGRDEILVLRVGLALGDLEAERGDLHGIAANEAARLCALAGPGEIVTSDLVRLVAGSRTDCELVNQRELELKGFPTPVTAWTVAWEPVAADAARTHVYALARAEDDRERARLRSFEEWTDPSTVRRLNETGVGAGWRCLEVGAGAGAIARWLGHRVGATGSVTATDIDLRYLTDLPTNVAARRHDISVDGLEPNAYDLVHCRSVLVHLDDPQAALIRMYDALAPGGWIVVEESDVGLLNMSGTPDAPRATSILEQVVSNWAAAGIMNTLLGRHIPALVRDLGVEAFRADAMTGLGSIGDPAYDAMRLAWPDVRHAGAAVGTPEADLACIDRAFESAATLMVVMTLFSAWGRKPQ